MTTFNEDRLRKAGFWGLVLFAFAPSLTGNLGQLQKVVRAPINLAIVWFVVAFAMLFTGAWWLGLIGLAAWFYTVPKLTRKVKGMIEGTTDPVSTTESL